MTPLPEYKGADYRSAGKLEEKRALITGGDSGIGRAVAYFFACEGADDAIVYLPAEEKDAMQIASEIRSLGRRSICIPGDVTDPAFCRAAVERTVAELGGLDVLVNNAAFQQHQEAVTDLSIEQWEKTFRTNIHA